jgi:hypothetical protein
MSRDGSFAISRFPDFPVWCGPFRMHSRPQHGRPALRWRLCTLIAVFAAAIAISGSLAAAAPQTPPPAAAGARPDPVASFATFRLIGDWNIFDSTRTSRKSNDPPPPAGDTISLVGTMQYDKSPFVFFDSPDADYRKALHEGDTIAGFTVARITANGVELSQESKRLSLAVGQQLHRPEGGQWTVSAAARADLTPTTDAAQGIPADASDVLKRLMEQRQKQLRQ